MAANEPANIRRFDQLVKYLRDELDWPLQSTDFEDLTFDFTPEELGIDPKNAAKIQEIKRLRPLSPNQPWGVFFVKFEPKRLPIVALRRILNSVVLKRRSSANSAERKSWDAEDLLFISNHGGGGDGRQITFAHFSQGADRDELPTLKVLGWDSLDTPLHIDHVGDTLRNHLRWPENEEDAQAWRADWSQAFALRYQEVVATSRALAIRLAELARAIRNRISTALAIETESGPLSTLMRAFRDALVHDLDVDGFADMYAQTIAYGLLSARIANPKADNGTELAAHVPATSPFLRELMESFLQAGDRRAQAESAASLDFDELGIREVVGLLDHANMEAVIRDFGDRNPQEDPVIHFYELFLKEYDAKKRMQRGVFYTPRPVVSHIVGRVHELLKADFGLKDGLADTATWGEVAAREGVEIPVGVAPTDRFINILDPATGTGTFLVEVINVIRETLSNKWSHEGYSEREALDLWNEYVPRELLPRLCAYELLMAPYAIAHLKVGLKLKETGYRFKSKKRARIFLTNALEPASDFTTQLEFTIPALAREAKAVNEVKSTQHFTVVLGNPPYAGHSANNSLAWIVDKVYDYKRDYPDLMKPGQAKWLQDDYVKFFRLAQWILDRTGSGVLSFISNHSYLANPTFRGMRAGLLRSFPEAYFLDLHGNSKKKERSPGGGIDQNVFEIQQGVAISRLVRSGRAAAKVMHGDLWGTASFKLGWLAHSDPAAQTFWSRVNPAPPQFVLAPVDADLDRVYQAGWSLKDIFSLNGAPAPGIVTTQDQFAIGFSREDVSRHVNSLLDTANEAEARRLFRLCTQSQWNYANAKKALVLGTWRDELTPILYRPFDQRWTVFNPHVAVHRRERVMRHMLSGRNLGLIVTRSVEIGRGFEHVFCSRLIIQHHTVSLKEVNFLLPLFLESSADSMLVAEESRPNLSPSFLVTLDALVGAIPDPEDVFGYIYAVLHSPAYRARYADFLKNDFPRVPLPRGVDIFEHMARLGTELVSLHLVETPAQQGISVRFNPDRQSWATMHGNKDPVNVNFEGPENPLIGKVEWSEETVWLDGNAREQSLRARFVGAAPACFRGVTEKIWNFHIGGYQICEKWLKDRRGRRLSADDIAHYCRIVLALHETIRIMNEVDNVIEGYGGWAAAFSSEPVALLPQGERPYTTTTEGEELMVAETAGEGE